MFAPDPSATAFGALVCSVWLAFLIGWLVAKSCIVSDAAGWFRRQTVPARVLAACTLLAAVAVGGNKGGGNAPQGLPRPPPLLRAAEPAAEPAIAPVTVRTNGVVLRAESTNAVEIAAFRTVGGTELGDWIEAAAPFFAVGTNPVGRCFVSASGSVSFESTRRPPVGTALPDGTGLPVLCPLRAPLGMVPEANWTNAGTQSRFWHDALPGGGRVLTWENALLDRLPGRRVSLQVELLPTGDCSFRYDFHDGLDPPPTNFAMGAQMGTNGVNALSVFGTNLLAATVWNVDGAPVANGVSVAGLLCTNGVLRTPAAFEIFWRNTTGIDPDADTDADGLADGAEIFLWGTCPDCADTDADGTPDGVELMSGTDPLDADEDGNGIPDGLSPDAYAANPLWAEGAEDANLSIVLRSAIPPGASATLVVGGLALPLRSPATYGLSIPPGEYVPFRLLSRKAGTVDLALGDPSSVPPRRGGDGSNPVWARDPTGVFQGAAETGSGGLAVPVVHLRDRRGRETEESECVHDTGYFVKRFYDFWAEPRQMGLTTDDLSLDGFVAESPSTLSLSFEGWHPSGADGWAFILPSRLRRGSAGAWRSIHRCAGAESYQDCELCGFPHSDREPCPKEYDHGEETSASGGATTGGESTGDEEGDGQDPPEYSCSLMLHVAWQDMDGNGVPDCEDDDLAPGSEVVAFTAIGSTAGDCCCGLDTGPDPLTARLVSHSPNLRLWDESGALLAAGDSLRTFRIQATAPSPSLGGSTVRYEIVGPENDVRRAVTIRVTAWDMWCTGLAFNHDAAAHADDAINLRHDFHGAVVLPEWTCAASHSAGPSRSEPACWIAGTTPTVRGRFAVRPAGITNAVVGAWHLGPVLSPVAPTAVVFSNGVTHASGETNLADFAAFPLSSPIPAVVARSTDERWGWQVAELNGQATSGFVGTNGPSVAYAILGAPVAPWSDIPGVSSNAWVSALDVVCANGWAKGQATLDEVADSVARAIFNSGCFKYDIVSGATKLLDKNNHFLLSTAIGAVKNSTCIEVNCSDCARLTMSLSNLLGCQLYSSRMGWDFALNPISAIGRTPWTPPNWGLGFSYHEVAWSGTCTDQDRVFDACLQFDGDNIPSSAPHTPAFASNMIFSDGLPSAPLVYRERLASPGPSGYDKCLSRPTTRIRYPIR